MFQISQIRNLILPFFLMVSYMCASAFNLPTKTINGKEYYYYNVQAHETIYSIAHKLNTTKDEIVKYNPSAIDGIKYHDVLYFPKDETSISTQTKYISHIVKKKETIYGISRQYSITVDQLIADNPSAQDGIKAGETLRIALSTISIENNNTEFEQTFSDNIDSEVEASQSYIDLETTAFDGSNINSYNDLTINPDSLLPGTTNLVQYNGPTQVAIMLPFMLNREKALKQDRLYTDFYRGFLMALNRLQEPSNIIVQVYDTADSLSMVKEILAKDEMKEVDLIIAPKDDDHLDLIASFANEHKCHVLNLFNIKNQLHKTNKWVIQGNISQEEMYKSAINFIIDSYKGMTPVFLRNKEHLSDKIKFTTQLKVALDTADIDYIEIAYTDIFDDEMNKLNDTTSYVFIPTSSEKKDLVVYAIPLCRLKSKTPNRQLNIFGYPEWITFKGSITERMSELGTTFYSRFGYSNKDDNAFNNEFKQWFGNEPILSYPNQALLGYDVAQYLLESVSTYGSFNPEHNYTGLQSNFNIVTTDDCAGYINDSVLFISLGTDN